MQGQSIFSERALTTIFEGDVESHRKQDGSINNYRVRGFRYEDEEQMRISGCTIKQGTRSICDARGVYRAVVRVRGVGRSPNESSFFPRHMAKEDVVQAISQAYMSRRLIDVPTRLWEGKAGALVIMLWLDESERIIDARPKYKLPTSKAVRAVMRYEQTGHRSKLLCHVCLKPKVLICPDGHGTKQRGLYNRFIKLGKKLRRYVVRMLKD